MKISGFSMIKNADKLYYPICQAIESILPIVDEFIVAVGNCDNDDNTRKNIESIGSSKIKIIDTVWNIEKFPNGMENAHQTDIAKNQCSGDWLFYLQADEVVHENYLPVIVESCKQYLDNKKIEALVFDYVHFWGDYWHFHQSHNWYSTEIRIVRNNPEIHSWESAQSFRRIPDFDGINYRQQKNTYKLNAAKIDAKIFHYGWVRPPKLMRMKSKALDTIHKGEKKAEELYASKSISFDYGPMNYLEKFTGTHPEVMQTWIKRFDWKDQLQFTGKPNNLRPLHKHEKTKYRIISWIENNLLFGKKLGEFRNYTLVK